MLKPLSKNPSPVLRSTYAVNLPGRYRAKVLALTAHLNMSASALLAALVDVEFRLQKLKEPGP